ncbi:MAG: hypothetical protein R3B72_38945 [Polyangiaceae bacterium]
MAQTQRIPTRYDDDHESAWDRVKDALHCDWEQTKNDFNLGGQALNQDVGDTVKQATGAEPMPPPGVPNTDWDELESAVRYGHAARLHYDQHQTWDDRLDHQLRHEWDSMNGAPSSDRYRPAVKYGWGYDTKSKSLPV